MIFLLIIVFIGVALFEIPGLIRKKHWRELTVYSLLLLLAFAMTLLQTLGVKMPSPTDSINYLIKDILHLNYG